MAHEIDLDQQFPEEEPSISIGDLIRWAPVLEEIITAVEAVLAGQAMDIPVIRIKLHGKHLALGPTPVLVT